MLLPFVFFPVTARVIFDPFRRRKVGMLFLCESKLVGQLLCLCLALT